MDVVDIYSLVAISCYFSRHYGTCGKAFARLESTERRTAEETENASSSNGFVVSAASSSSPYADLATSIFLRYPPVDPGNASAASKPDIDVAREASARGDWAALARNVCVASGRRIGVAEKAVSCGACAHRSLVAELGNRQTCPLCFQKFQTDAREGKRPTSNAPARESSAGEQAEAREEVRSPTAPRFAERSGEFW